jgi:hypothetical protein
VVEIRLGFYQTASLGDENGRADQLVLEGTAAVTVDGLGQLAVEAL